MKDDKNQKGQEENAFEGLGALFGGLGKAIADHKEKFISQFDIKFPVEIKGVKSRLKRPRSGAVNGMDIGSLVSIRPCAEKYEDKTFLGMYLGDLPSEILFEIERETDELHMIPLGNPAIYVFKLKTVIFGAESWWGEIKKEDDLERLISDADIQNVWYERAMKAMAQKPEGKKK